MTGALSQEGDHWRDGAKHKPHPSGSHPLSSWGIAGQEGKSCAGAYLHPSCLQVQGHTHNTRVESSDPLGLGEVVCTQHSPQAMSMYSQVDVAKSAPERL